MSLSLVIPCYNEEKNISILIEKLKPLIEKQVEIILVDNGSIDESSQVINSHIKGYKNVKLCRISKNIGYGHGIVSGLKLATGDVLSWTHADLQTDPTDVLKAYDEYKKKGNELIIVKGKRSKRPFIDTFFTFGMQFVSNILLKTWLSDINAQPKLFSREFYNSLNDLPEDFSLDLYVLFMAKKRGYEIKTIPVCFSKREYGEAKGGGSFRTKWNLMKRTFSYIKKFRKDTA